MDAEKSPVVFISYSKDSLAFANKVLELSNRLRSEGIDTILDQYEEAPEEGWPRWMENNIDRSDYVLVISTQGYHDKMYGKLNPAQGKGVKWETNIIYQKLYNSGSINKKFIPVVFCSQDIDYIPTPLQGSTFYNVSDNTGYEELYWRLRGISTKQKPPLGKLRALPEKERKTLFITTMIDMETWDKAIWRGAGFLMSFQETPILTLLFKNEDYATKIFSDWIKYIGPEDKKEDIRVALVEGEVKGEASGYYVVIGTNLGEAFNRAKATGLSEDDICILNISRIIRANPTDNFQCFNMFKALYEFKHDYYLVPAVLNESTGQFKPLMQYRIHKHTIDYRNISDISENDQDAILLDKNNHSGHI